MFLLIVLVISFIIFIFCTIYEKIFKSNVIVFMNLDFSLGQHWILIFLLALHHNDFVVATIVLQNPQSVQVLEQIQMRLKIQNKIKCVFIFDLQTNVYFKELLQQLSKIHILCYSNFEYLQIFFKNKDNISKCKKCVLYLNP